jgi:hypothetical protein
MALAISTLVPFLRMAIDDNDISGDYENTDARLIDYLRFGILASESDWNQGYTIALNETVYEVSPDPPIWCQMLFVIKTAIMMRTFTQVYSYQIPAIKITRTSKTEDLAGLQQIYNAIIQERRFSTVGYCFNSFDDLFTRPNLILSDIEEGYR